MDSKFSHYSEDQLSKFRFSDLSRMTGLKQRTLQKRVESGWTYYDAVNTPLLKSTQGVMKPKEEDRKITILRSISQGIQHMRLQPKFIPNQKPFEVWML